MGTLARCPGSGFTHLVAFAMVCAENAGGSGFRTAIADDIEETEPRTVDPDAGRRRAGAWRRCGGFRGASRQPVLVGWC